MAVDVPRASHASGDRCRLCLPLRNGNLIVGCHVAIFHHVSNRSWRKSWDYDWAMTPRTLQLKPRRKTINFHEWLGGGWGFCFRIPDLHPSLHDQVGVWPELKGEFDKRGVKILAISVDPLDSHRGWMKDINDVELHRGVPYHCRPGKEGGRSL